MCSVCILCKDVPRYMITLLIKNTNIIATTTGLSTDIVQWLQAYEWEQSLNSLSHRQSEMKGSRHISCHTQSIYTEFSLLPRC